ncbi:acyltransferase [bacterium 1XD42-1]|nr:acyltransferase [bacterium 1XD42-1]
MYFIWWVPGRGIFLYYLGFSNGKLYKAEGIYPPPPPREGSGVGNEAIQFIFHKIQRIYPPYLLAFVMTFVLRQYIAHVSFKELLKNMLLTWSELSFLRLSGIIEQIYNSPTWYLSAMFIAMLIIYPLLRTKRNLYQNCIAPLLCIFIYGYFSQTYHFIAVVTQWTGLALCGVLRAIAGLSLGTICFSIVEFLRKISFKRTKTIRFLFWILEIYSLTVILLLMHLTKRGIKFRSNLDFTTVLFIALLVILIFEENQLFNISYSESYKKWCVFLGKYSVSVYLNQRFSLDFVNYFCQGQSAFVMITFYLLLSAFLALISMAILRILKEPFQIWGRDIKNFLLE